MLPKYTLLFVLLATCLLDCASSRPSNNESGPFKIEMPVEDTPPQESQTTQSKHERSIYYQADPSTELEDDTTRDIVDKIKAINDGLKKPNRQQINYNKPPASDYMIDKDILEKIQQAIASGKLHINNYSSKQNDQESNYIQSESESYERYLNSKALKQHAGMSHAMPYPYIMNVPVMVMPQNFEIHNRLGMDDDMKSIFPNQLYQTRQESSFPGFPSLPSLPFQNIFQWPFAQFFPLIIKDPFLAFSQSGGWNNLIEYGQNADVCNRKQKSVSDSLEEKDFIGKDVNAEPDLDLDEDGDDEYSRKSRSLMKRNVNQRSTTQEIDNEKQSKKIYVTTKPISTNAKIKTTKKPYIIQEVEEVKNEESGDLRFPFGDFSWFGNKKPVAPSPGFFINKLRVRKGGVAIAGPGGVATAGRGGTAIVGPGGLAYTQPGGLAVAGPAARVVALSPDADLNSLITRIHQEDDPSVPRSHQPIRDGKLVATGPVVYYHPIERRNASDDELQSSMDSYYYDGFSVMRAPIADTAFVLHLRPSASAVSGSRGASIANPVSQVLVRGGGRGSIVHAPAAAAVAGPGGIAHALSELYVYDNDST